MRRFILVLGTISIIVLMAINLCLSDLCTPKVISEEGTFELNEEPVWVRGEWNFYPDIFLEVPRTEKALTTVTNIPWNSITTDGEPRGPYGFGTYHVRAELPNEGLYGLYIPWINTAYRLYIDGKLKASAGTVGTSVEEHEPAYLPQYVSFTAEKEYADIVLHVSNYNHYYGGLVNPLLIGTHEQVSRIYTLLDSLTAVIVALMFFSSAFVLMLFAHPHRDYKLLYIAALALLVAFRISIGSTMLIYRVFPNFPWELGLRLEYMVISLAIFCFLGYFRNSYPNVFRNSGSHAIGVLSLFFSALTLILPVVMLNYLLKAMYAFLFVAVLFWTALVFTYGLYKQNGKRMELVGAFAFSAAAIFDAVRYAAGFPLYIPIITSSVGLMYMVFILVYTYTQQFLQSLIRTERLAEELELKVQERTEELEQLNERFYNLAVRDNLTGLWNRNELETRIAAEMRRYEKQDINYGAAYNVFYIDIDNFKYFNDTFDHETGDRALAYFADALVMTSRRSDTVFRIGGDEFLIFLPNTDREESGRRAGRILELLGQSREQMLSSCIPENHPKRDSAENLNCTIGIAVHEHGHLDLHALIRHADEALLFAKGLGKNRYYFYGEEL